MPPEKVRLLFVDDEADLLASLRASLRSERKRFAMRFACGGLEALDMLEQEPADIVISDMRMPGMDGATLLTHVKDRWPATVRLVLSGQANRELAVRASTVAHQWMQKPTGRAQLLAVIERVWGTLQRVQQPKIQRWIGGLQGVPAQPKTYLRFREVVSCPEVDMDQVAEVVGSDPGLALKVMQLVHSAFFGLASVPSNIREAVGILGTDMLGVLLLSAEVFESHAPKVSTPGFSNEDLITHSLLTSRMAGEILRGDSRAGQASATGLLHKLGIYLFANQHGEWFTPRRTLEELEETEFGVTHCELGGALLALWGLPLEMVETVLYHVRPSEAQPTEVGPLVAIHVASSLCAQRLLDRGARLPLTSYELDPELFAQPTIAAQLPAWESLADRLCEPDAPPQAA